MPVIERHRHIEPRLREALADSPVVLIQGPRQCGKTTLVRMLGRTDGYKYISFDEVGALAAAKDDPTGFVRDLPERVILDEVQRVPEIFSMIKLSVDRNRTPGRFILTGSVNVLQVHQITDSLAGRMDILSLHPFSQNEIERTTPDFLDSMFRPTFSIRQDTPAIERAIERVLAGGFPPALTRSVARRPAWYLNTINALIERDVPSMVGIRSLDAMPKLLQLAAAQTAQLLSINGLASSFQLNRLTIDNYLALLEKMFLLERLPAWHSNRAKYLVTTPKIHLCDTGMACALMGLSKAALLADRSVFGHLLETFVLQELKRQASAHPERHNFHHFRDKKGAEVDIVIDRGINAVVGVEVKASATVRAGDFKGLRKLKAAAGHRFVSGALLYNGDTTLVFNENLYALPLRSLWEKF